MEISEASAARDRRVIHVEGEALVAQADSAWDAAVPTCPGWDVGTLLVHTSGAHRLATATLRARRRVRHRDLPAPPEGRGAQLAWYREGLGALLDVVEETDPFAETWTWGGVASQRAWWWVRRMAQETGVHRWDAANAAQRFGATGETATGFDPEVAAAGVDEYLVDFLPRLPVEQFDGLTGSLHLHATDADGEWTFDLDHPSVPARREHAKSDTAVRGRASDLLLWLWNRQPAAGHLAVFGDQSVATGWSRIAM
jgi:uncharacterized protein (TIGR03083 family)